MVDSSSSQTTDPILVKLRIAHEAAIANIVTQFAGDVHAMAAEIARLRMELFCREEAE
jgi:hypothetical protein